MTGSSNIIIETINNSIGDEFIKEGNIPSAIENYEYAIKHNPQWITPLVNLARALSLSRDYHLNVATKVAQKMWGIRNPDYSSDIKKHEDMALAIIPAIKKIYQERSEEPDMSLSDALKSIIEMLVKRGTNHHDNHQLLLKSLEERADINYKFGSYNEALYCHTKALQIADKLQDSTSQQRLTEAIAKDKANITPQPKEEKKFLLKFDEKICAYIAAIGVQLEEKEETKSNTIVDNQGNSLHFKKYLDFLTKGNSVGDAAFVSYDEYLDLLAKDSVVDNGPSLE